jgi:hypothetical protein
VGWGKHGASPNLPIKVPASKIHLLRLSGA